MKFKITHGHHVGEVHDLLVTKTCSAPRRCVVRGKDKCSGRLVFSKSRPGVTKCEVDIEWLHNDDSFNRFGFGNFITNKKTVNPRHLR